MSSDSLAWALVRAAPDGLLVVNEAGTIVVANRRAEELFGYERGALLRESVETLVPAEQRATHQRHRALYCESPHTRPMGTGLPLRGLRRDGTTFRLDITLSPLVKGSSRLVIATIRPHDDADRDRIAAHVLDTVVRRLFAIGLTLQSALQSPIDIATARVEQAIAETDEAIQEIRNSIFDEPRP